jgi:hypothetical protein
MRSHLMQLQMTTANPNQTRPRGRACFPNVLIRVVEGGTE